MISVVILTKNSARTLKATLESTRAFPEVVIADTGSTDDTLKIASSFPNCKIIHLTFENGFGPTRNKASESATYDWIFSLDSDEVVTADLSTEILSLSLEPSQVYAILRDNYFNGKHIKGCSGWYPDWVLRLYHRKSTSFSQDAVHERVLSKGMSVHKLHFSLKHTPYLSITDFLDKMQKYSSLFAEQKKRAFCNLFFCSSSLAFCLYKKLFFKKRFFTRKRRVYHLCLQRSMHLL